MAGFTQAYARTVLDSAVADTDYIAWSANGTTETGDLARTAVTEWTAASDASPTVVANLGALTSAAASDAVTVSHFAIFTAATDGTQRTDWTELDSPRTLAIGDKLSIAAEAIEVTLD